MLPFHGLFLSANTGADASASGGRGECVWGQRRSCLGAEADADGAKFADKLGICIYEASGGAAASLVCVASSLSAPFGKRIQTVKRRICIPIEHFKYNANWEQSIKHKFA